MILRLLRVRVLPGAAAELVSRLREQAVPQIAATPGLVGLNYGFRQQAEHTFGVAVSVWQDYRAIEESTAGDPARVGTSMSLDDVVDDVRIAHYEVSESAGAQEISVDGAVIAVALATLKPHVEPVAFDIIRSSAAAVYEAGAVARYIGRRVAGARSEAVSVAVWPNRAAIRRYARNRPEGFFGPTFLGLLEEWSFETYDSLSPSRLLVSSAGPAVLLADDEGRYVDASPGVERVFGLPGEFMLGRCVWDFTPADDLDAGREMWRDFLASGRQEGEYPLARPGGTPVTVRYVALANCPERGLHASLLSLPTDPPDERPFEQIMAEAFPALPVAG